MASPLSLYDNEATVGLPISVPFQCKRLRKKKETQHLKKKKQYTIHFVKAQFGIEQVILKPSKNGQYWSVDVPAGTVGGWLWKQLQSLHEQPTECYEPTLASFKQLKPTLQEIGFRMEITLLGYLHRVYLEFNIPHVADLKSMLFNWDEETHKVVISYRQDCSTRSDPTNAWSDSRNQTWKIVVGFIRKIIAHAPSLRPGDLLNLAQKTKVQSLYAKGNSKPFEVLCSKGKSCADFCFLRRQWNVSMSQTFAERTFSWEDGTCVKPRPRPSKKIVSTNEDVPMQQTTFSDDLVLSLVNESPQLPSRPESITIPEIEPSSIEVPAPLKIYQEYYLRDNYGRSFMDWEIKLICENPNFAEKIENLFSEKAIEYWFGVASYEQIASGFKRGDPRIVSSFREILGELSQMDVFNNSSFESFCRMVQYVLGESATTRAVEDSFSLGSMHETQMLVDTPRALYPEENYDESIAFPQPRPIDPSFPYPSELLPVEREEYCGEQETTLSFSHCMAPQMSEPVFYARRELVDNMHTEFENQQPEQMHHPIFSPRLSQPIAVPSIPVNSQYFQPIPVITARREVGGVPFLPGRSDQMDVPIGDTDPRQQVWNQQQQNHLHRLQPHGMNNQFYSHERTPALSMLNSARYFGYANSGPNATMADYPQQRMAVPRPVPLNPPLYPQWNAY